MCIKQKSAIVAILLSLSLTANAKELVPVTQTASYYEDLLTGGLGMAGLRNAIPPSAGDPVSIEGLRQRALWANWRGIADLSQGGGYGDLYGKLDPVSGRQYSALLNFKKNKQLHRVMVQIPENFDLQKRCLVVTASSGSRGIYGAIALAGAWGLNHGCAVAYTDKGAGSGFLVSNEKSIDIDGLLNEGNRPSEFHYPSTLKAIAVKHAHSGDNPEADWGRYVKQAAEYGLSILNSHFPKAEKFTHKTTHTMAVGVSNGGGAVLRAAEIPGNWLDGVVAISPNIYSPGSRPLYDYSTEAALFMPCALNANAFNSVVYARPGGAKSPVGSQRCDSLSSNGLISGTGQEQAEQAWLKLQKSGWTEQALIAGAISTAFDLWRAVNVTYSSAYLRASPDNMPCGFHFETLDVAGKPRKANEIEQLTWWSDGTGIPPTNGVGIVDSKATGIDASYAGLSCLRSLWQTKTSESQLLQASVGQTKAKMPRTDLPILVIHGLSDGLVPLAFTSDAYVKFVQGKSNTLRYWQIENAQHFDAFLGQPVLAMQYVPLMPYAYKGLDAMWSHIEQGTPLPSDRVFKSKPRKLLKAELEPLSDANLDF